MEVAFAEAAATAAAAGDDPRTVVRRHARAHLAALFEHGPYTAAHVTAFHTAPVEVRTPAIARRDAYEALWTELLRRLVDDGSLRADLDVGTSRLILFGALNTTVDWFDPHGRSTLDDLAEHITDLFWSGAAA